MSAGQTCGSARETTDATVAVIDELILDIVEKTEIAENLIERMQWAGIHNRFRRLRSVLIGIRRQYSGTPASIEDVLSSLHQDIAHIATQMDTATACDDALSDLEEAAACLPRPSQN